MKLRALILFLGSLILSAGVATAAGLGDELATAFKDGTFDVDLRYRYEYVDDDLATKDANASTLRTRLVYKSADFRDFSVTLNMDDLRPIVGDNFNDTRNGKTQYAVVADPKGTDLNLASLNYTGLKNTAIVFGRQRIIRANARFIGNVGWRQNEQTYDSLSINYKLPDRLDVFYAYVDSVKRIFGPDAPDNGPTASRFKSDSHLFDASYTFNPAIVLSGYAYLLDLENAPAASSETYGVRLSGAPKIGSDFTVTYVAEYAEQEDYADNTNDYDAGYYVLEAGLNWSMFGIKAGYEVLEADGATGQSFQTPLATGHKFNGWADRFLATPAGGLEDLYIVGSANILGGKMSLVYHDFSQETGGADYGDEIDFVANWKLGEHYSVLGKFALYSGDSSAPSVALQSDVSKFWLMMTAAF
jgi:hypothetical protein